MDLLEKAIREEMTKDVDGTSFYIRQSRGGQEINNLMQEVKESISKCGLSASEAKGFLEYMKLVIDSAAYLLQKK